MRFVLVAVYEVGLIQKLVKNFTSSSQFVSQLVSAAFQGEERSTTALTRYSRPLASLVLPRSLPSPLIFHHAAVVFRRAGSAMLVTTLTSACTFYANMASAGDLASYPTPDHLISTRSHTRYVVQVTA